MRHLHTAVPVVLGAALLVLTGAAPARALEPFRASGGRFAVDLPEGYRPAHQKHPTLFQFRGDGPMIIMLHMPDEDSPEDALDMAVHGLRGSVPNAEPAAPVETLTVNGRPARWGIYRGTVGRAGAEARLYATVGAVRLEQGSVYFLAIYNEERRAAWEPRLRAVFGTIRVPGAPEGTAAPGAPAG